MGTDCIGKSNYHTITATTSPFRQVAFVFDDMLRHVTFVFDDMFRQVTFVFDDMFRQVPFEENLKEKCDCNFSRVDISL